MFRPFRLVPIALALAVGLAGCSKTSDSTAPPFLDQDFADEIAQHVGMVLAAGHGGSMLTLTVTAATVPAGAPVSQQISQDAARAARDTLFPAGNVAWAVVDTFYTAGGTAQPDYDALSTRVSMHAIGNGEVHSAVFHATLAHRADLQGTGLSVTRDTLYMAGTARDSSRSRFTAKFSTATVRLLCVSSITHQNVVTLKGQSPFTPPLGALCDWNMTVTRFGSSDTTSVDRTMSVETIVAFDGTSKAVIQVGGLYEYQVDLDTGDLTRYGAQRIAAR